MEVEYQLTVEEAEKGFSVWHQESLHQKLTVPVIVSGEKTSLARIVFQ